jgi:hypothetical protein
MDLGFIVLCPNKNIAGLRHSLCSIRNNSYNREALAVVANNVNATELKEMKELCPTHKGKDTIASMINAGMKKMKNEWAFLIFEGGRIQPYLEKKLVQFAKTQNDILFPVFERGIDFVSGPFNGVLINTKFFEEVGCFPDISVFKEDGMNEFEMAKLFWCIEAIEKKAVFKAIVGMKVS